MKIANNDKLHLFETQHEYIQSLTKYSLRWYMEHDLICCNTDDGKIYIAKSRYTKGNVIVSFVEFMEILNTYYLTKPENQYDKYAAVMEDLRKICTKHNVAIQILPQETNHSYRECNCGGHAIKYTTDLTISLKGI